MTYSKKTLLLLSFIVLCSGVALANPAITSDKEKEKKSAEQCDQEKKKKSTSETLNAEPKPVNYSAASEKSRQEIPGLKSKEDSSSVLSYNFIFYLVYKFRYTESEEGFSQESRTTD